MSVALTLLGVGLAGALGAAARYALIEWVAPRWRGAFPLATFVINVSGAFALAFVLGAGVSLVASHAISHATQTQLGAVVGAGFLGGYTTFSTLSLETHTLALRGWRGLAWLNAAGSLLVGMLAVVAGLALGRLV
ncbi:MAG TPA: CrcB family protein [Ktedonobacterales bacterium]|nr:CrcB family protein [Ktedonobacterales bacterium]